ncbi:PREDICTED: ATP-dependent DNA helicase RecQ-like [Priapulus caudatus]|uniref:DNA 3'-5' helicase n=1 Tax=Priapulus caudatus TaxID=37621 RepID=A0ABM1EIJ9_PRICU|nr:PREDICTED: ATP-dependent DNA helicase RecQ-like [Priapulus caudatus]
MFNQVEILLRMGVSAAAILPPSELHPDTKRGLLAGKFTVVFCSPEAMSMDIWREMIVQLGERLCLFTCDEAHCISEWGLDFRPEYMEISRVYSILPKSTRWLFLTATCTDQLHQSILDILNIKPDEVQTIAAVPDRKNIYIKWKTGVRSYKQELEWLVDHMRTAGPNAEKTIIYCRSINQVAAVYEDLLSRIGEDAWQGKTHTMENLGITMYHGSIGKLQEQYVLNTFVKVDSIVRCVVCTIAFGMGIQVTDVRHIIQWDRAMGSCWLRRCLLHHSPCCMEINCRCRQVFSHPPQSSS